MPNSEKLRLFIERVMDLNVLRMGGASAGIIGASGTDNVILNNLKRSTVAFAREYSRPTSSQLELVGLSQDIYGYLQTLQVTYTLSETEADGLMDELQALMNKSSGKK
jgi:hypothetical protein